MCLHAEVAYILLTHPNGIGMKNTTVTISELFYSIQGETSFSGLPAVFVRLSGCNLKCLYCDTDYAQSGGTNISIGDIFAKVSSYACNLVVITGGEPLMQPGIFELIPLLKKDEKTVLVETNGSLDIREIPRDAIRIVDVKSPSSGESENNLISNMRELSNKDELKFVIGSRDDYLWAVSFIKTYNLLSHSILFSPVTSCLQPRNLAEWILNDRVPVRLQLQLHKTIWGANARGV